MDDDGVHVVNNATRTCAHLAIPGRSTAVCGESTEGGEDLGIARWLERHDNEAPPCMACNEIWSIWRGLSVWEGDGPRPDEDAPRRTSRDW